MLPWFARSGKSSAILIGNVPDNSWPAAWWLTAAIFIHQRKCRNWDSIITRLDEPDITLSVPLTTSPARSHLVELHLEVLQRQPQSFLQTYLRFPSQQLFRLRDIRAALLRIIFRQGFVNDCRRVRKLRANVFREFVNRHFRWIPDVRGIVLIGLAEPVDSLDQVRNVAETPRLLPISIHRQRLSAERLKHKIRQRPAIVQTHP